MGKKVDKLKPGPYDFVRVDSQQQIDICLNCEKEECDNCITNKKKNKYAKERYHANKLEKNDN